MTKTNSRIGSSYPRPRTGQPKMKYLDLSKLDFEDKRKVKKGGSDA